MGLATMSYYERLGISNFYCIIHRQQADRIQDAAVDARTSRSPGRWGGPVDKKPNEKTSSYFTNASRRRKTSFAIFPRTTSMYLSTVKNPKSFENPILENNSLTFDTLWQKVVP